MPSIKCFSSSMMLNSLASLEIMILWQIIMNTSRAVGLLTRLLAFGKKSLASQRAPSGSGRARGASLSDLPPGMPWGDSWGIQIGPWALWLLVCLMASPHWPAPAGPARLPPAWVSFAWKNIWFWGTASLPCCSQGSAISVCLSVCPCPPPSPSPSPPISQE